MPDFLYFLKKGIYFSFKKKLKNLFQSYFVIEIC